MIFKPSEIRKGSAYLFVIGAISVLSIIVFFFFRAGSSRRFSTRMMSDEKKAEALAESAVDLVMGYIREKMNDDGSDDYFLPFRYPCDLPSDDIGQADGKNIPVDMANYADPFLEMEGSVSALKPLEYIIEELGGDQNVKLKVSLSVPYAEALSAKKGTYEVVGISERSAPAGGASAEFLDSVSKLGSPPSDGTLSSVNSDWKLDFKMPNGTYSDSHSISVDLGGYGVIVKATKKVVTISKLNPDDKDQLKLYITFHVKVVGKLTGKTYYELKPTDPKGNITVDVPTEIKEYVKIADDATNLTMEGIRKQAMEGNYNGTGISWKASKLAQEIDNEWSGLPSPIKGKIKTEPFGGNPQVVEKTGVLQIKAEVEYWPNGPTGKKIEKKLIANRTFKVSDIQPPAPEYSLFVANSELIFEEDDNLGFSLGDPIDWAPTTAVASICVHNLPEGRYDKCTGMEGVSGSAGKLAQVPGMIRVNSRGEMKINTFLGTAEEPYLTEFNTLVNKLDVSRYKVIPTFRWNDSPPSPTKYTVEFPVINDTSSNDVWSCTGFDQVLKYLENCNAIRGPTLFFGDCFLEYPLGMCVEAKLKQRYGTVVFQVKPKGKKGDPSDVSEIKITYINKEKKYGLNTKEAYDAGSWSPDSQNCKPANLYSLLQYAKKATHFYKSAEDFWADSERFAGGVYDCTGVTYVKGSLNISNEFKVKGKGILVVKDDIVLTKNVKRADDKTVFSLIARAGYMHVKDGCDIIEASCFSNASPVIEKTDKLEINGNLVLNQLDRDTIDYLEVNYNSAACRVSPLSVMRDVGKFDPKRYIVSVADTWSSYKFEKMGSD
ncbi:MAG: hypothetical protein ACOYXC_14095 [Candidatus Rifleibacteriota bacterium]